MKKMLWIGSYLNDEMTAKAHEFGYKNPASVLSQKNIHDGIEEVTENKFDSLGVLSVSGFPRNKKLFIPSLSFSHTTGAADKLAGYLNIEFINRLTGRISLNREVKKWIRNNRTEDAEIYVYEMRSACLSACKLIKKALSNAKIHLIVPDLPQFMDLKCGKLKKTLKAIDWKSISGNLKYVDDYILYAAPMAEFLKIPDGKWMLMEGTADIGLLNSEDIKKESKTFEKTVLMYSGSINYGFKIKNLLDSVSYLDESFELWFTGGGDAIELVKEYEKNDGRIKYFGFLPTIKDLEELRSNADFLINMRDPDAPASKYCFPSKLFEYMASGKPVISCKLSGIPDEYYDYIIGLESIDPQKIAETVKTVSKMPLAERENLVSNAKKFIVCSKTKEIQAKRICEFTKL